MGSVWVVLFVFATWRHHIGRVNGQVHGFWGWGWRPGLRITTTVPSALGTHRPPPHLPRERNDAMEPRDWELLAALLQLEAREELAPRPGSRRRRSGSGWARPRPPGARGARQTAQAWVVWDRLWYRHVGHVQPSSGGGGASTVVCARAVR